MAITQTDIKLMASERLTDEDDGGGQMSAVEVEDGVVNNLYADISRLDRTYGRVNLRKCFPSIQTDNTDYYYGAHVIITDAPDDPNVSVIAFTTDSYDDERADAQDFIESYVVRGPLSDYTPYGDQLNGSRALRLYSRTDVPLPVVGKTYCLTIETDDEVTQYQYVRISSVDYNDQTFEDQNGEFTRRVYTLEIDAPLRYTFPGLDAPSRYSNAESPSLFRTTQIADAARYYSVVPVAQAIEAGERTARVSSIYGQLVPSTQVETPIADAAVGVDIPNIVASGEAYTINISQNEDGNFSFGRAVSPNSVHLVMGNGYATFEDDGSGNLMCTASSGTSYAAVGQQYGTVDYSTGAVIGARVYNTQDWTCTATPATAITDIAHTDSIAVGEANRGYNYVKTLGPIPQPGTLYVDYIVSGNWYRMSDDGNGNLSDGNGGVGRINYTTGTATITCGALPDSDSEIIFSWASNITYQIQTDDPDLEPAWMVFTVSTGDIVPGSLTLSWPNGDNTITVTDDGNGNFSGDDAEGRIIYGIGQVGVRPAVMPASSAAITIEYQTGHQETETVTNYSISGDNAIFTVSDGPIKPGSFHASFSQNWTKSSTGRRWDIEGGGINAGQSGSREGVSSASVYDIGNGTLSNGGTIDYDTGQINMPVSSHESRSYVNYRGEVNSYAYSGSLNGPISIRYQQDTVTPTDMTETAAIPDLTVDMTPTTYRQIVPGSLEFEWGGKIYIDRDGAIYTDWDRQSGAATAVGTIDYSTGQMALSDYDGGIDNDISIRTMLTALGSWAATGAYFRTTGAPLRTNSFALRATLPDGTTINGSTNDQGVIDTNNMQGTVEVSTGIVSVQFGRYVANEDLTDADKAESWYNADDVQDDGTIWYPIPVDPSSMRYNAVYYTAMSLDADILGLDPVRLPIDGRVPVIREGDVGVIHNTQNETLPANLTAGQTIQLSRTELAAAELRDQADTAVDTSLYTVDRETGIVTISDALDLSAYTQPLVARHRIEEMVLVNEAQINGQLTLVGTVSRDYPADGTFFSSALIIGDLGSRVHHLYSQETWSSNWADTRDGSPTDGQYNDRLFPIQISNRNAVKDRWAIVFTSTTSFQVIGESAGVIATGNTGEDCSPINPVSGEPYFVISADGWGGGWAVNNVLRFNTEAAHYPVWIARTTLSGTATIEDDSFKTQIRGDAD